MDKETKKEVWLKVPNMGWVFGVILGFIFAISFSAIFFANLLGKCD